MNHPSNESITMTYSSLLLKDGRKAICVRFERPTPNGIDYAEATLPNSAITKQQGFNEEEVASLELYLRANRDEILKNAKHISGFMNWFKD